MMKSRSHIFRPLLASIVFALLLCVGCRKSAVDPAQYRQEIEDWRKQRLTRLTGEDGWLTLIGLFWLKEGENGVGCDPANTITLPSGKAPEFVGSIWLEQGKPRFRSKPGSGVKHNDTVVTSLALLSDEDAAGPTILRLGPVSFYVIKRGDQYAVRVKDNNSEARLNFRALDYFPINPSWRVKARFEPYVPPKILEIPSQVGTVEKDSCPGALVFEIEGKTYRLDPVIEKGSEGQFFIMLADETNGKETYAVGRQLYTALPDSNNEVIIDFNKAYNWPCVFTDYATCPIPPPQNHLPIRVDAGEKMYRGHE